MSIKRWEIKNIRLVTPIMGGGVEPLTPDRECPVRPSEIRGQLRYWWRALQGFQTVEELKAAEAAVWGWTGRRSPVTVRIRDVSKDNVEAAPTRGPLGYVYFAARDTGAQVVSPGLRFSIELRYPAYPKGRRDEIRDAFALWTVFGGLGARTRRGSGAVAVAAKTPEYPFENFAGLEAWLEGLPAPDSTRPWPTLKGPTYRKVLKRMGKGVSWRQTWESWITTYKDFRQQRRRPGSHGPFGRSYWPEPDAIRMADGAHLKNPSRSHAPDSGAQIFFPRGAYGLPIVFHFKDGPQEGASPSPALDPPDYRLGVDTRVESGHEVTRDRWASPVILKILQLPDGETIKMCWVLDTDFPPSFTLLGPKGRRLLPAETPHAFRAKTGKSITVDGTSIVDPYEALCNWMDSVTPATGGPHPVGAGRPAPVRARVRAMPATKPAPTAGGTETGTVQWFNEQKGYGFIKADSGGGDVFVHYSAIKGTGLKTLSAGDKVRFTATLGPKGPQAVAVTVLTQDAPNSEA